MAGAPKHNTNAEKWTLELAEKLLLKALEMSKDPQYDFEGEIYQDMDIYRSQVNYITEKFPSLIRIHNMIKGNIESNCFRNAKKGDIDKTMAIITLKSNHQWIDRQAIDHTSKGDKLNMDTNITFVDGDPGT